MRAIHARGQKLKWLAPLMSFFRVIFSLCPYLLSPRLGPAAWDTRCELIPLALELRDRFVASSLTDQVEIDFVLSG